MSAIVHAADAAQAQQIFEDWCQLEQEGEQPAQTEIKKVVAAELVEQLLTESGNGPIDWPEISRKWIGAAVIAEAATEAGEQTVPEDLGEGYWVDVNHAVPPQAARLDIEALKRELPEDICSALNWSPEKQFLFLVSSLSAPVLPGQSEEPGDATEEQGEGNSRPILDEAVTRLPEMKEKEAAALVEARNSVVAAWLWRKFAATTHLAENEIVLNPCCAILAPTS